MTSEEVVRLQVAKNLCIAEYNLDDDLAALDADSLDLVNMVVEVENELHIEIPDKELDSVVTVQDFINVVEKCRQPTEH